MFPLQKFTATPKWVNQLKQGTLTGPFVFVIGYNLNVEYIFGTGKTKQIRYINEKKQNILTSLTSNSHSCKHIPNKVKDIKSNWHSALTSKRIVTGNMVKKLERGWGPVKWEISHVICGTLNNAPVDHIIKMERDSEQININSNNSKYAWYISFFTNTLSLNFSGKPL